MGFKNLPSFVQKIIDKILKPLKKFAKIYIEDIVSYSKKFETYINHLRQFFEMLTKLNVIFFIKKNVPELFQYHFLGQKIDAFGMSTTPERIKPLQTIGFPKNLQTLKQYLGTTGYLRNKIPYNIQKAEPLQKKKKKKKKTYFMKNSRQSEAKNEKLSRKKRRSTKNQFYYKFCNRSKMLPHHPIF